MSQTKIYAIFVSASFASPSWRQKGKSRPAIRFWDHKKGVPGARPRTSPLTKTKSAANPRVNLNNGITCETFRPTKPKTEIYAGLPAPRTAVFAVKTQNSGFSSCFFPFHGLQYFCILAGKGEVRIWRLLSCIKSVPPDARVPFSRL